MDNKDKPDSPKTTLRFGLKVDKIMEGKNVQFKIGSQNEGIPDAEIVLIVEAWLERVKENFKQPIKDGFTFFKTDKNK